MTLVSNNRCQCTWQCPKLENYVSMIQFLLIYKDHIFFLETKMAYLFWLGSHFSHTSAVLLHIPWDLDPNPRMRFKNPKFYNHHGERDKHYLKTAKFMEEWAIISIPTKILHLLLKLGNDKVPTSASIDLLNSSSSLSKICLYFSNSSAIFVYLSWRKCAVEKTLHDMKGKPFDNDVMIIKNSRWMPHNSHETIWVSHWLTHSLSLILIPVWQEPKSCLGRVRGANWGRWGPRWRYTPKPRSLPHQ